MRKVVLVDFNGVINDPSIIGNSRYPAHQIKDELCLKKFKLLADFVVKHNAIVISVSSFNYVFVFLEFGFLLEDEYPDLYTSFEKLFLEGMEYTVFSSDKAEMNSKLITSLKDFKVVCFEDQFNFDKSFNQIWTEQFTGLTEEHINIADKIFNS